MIMMMVVVSRTGLQTAVLVPPLPGAGGPLLRPLQPAQVLRVHHGLPPPEHHHCTVLYCTVLQVCPPRNSTSTNHSAACSLQQLGVAPSSIRLGRHQVIVELFQVLKVIRL